MWSIWNIICTLQTLYNGPVIVCLFTGTLLFDQFTLLHRKLIDSTLYPYCHTCCSTTMHYDLIPVLPQFRWVQAARHCRMLSREVETWNHHWGATGDWRSPTTSSSWKIASTKPGRTCSARHFGAAFRALLLRTTWSSIWYGIDLDAFKVFFATHVHCNHAKTPCTTLPSRIFSTFSVLCRHGGNHCPSCRCP